jgi:hypothetical protein
MVWQVLAVRVSGRNETSCMRSERGCRGPRDGGPPYAEVLPECLAGKVKMRRQLVVFGLSEIADAVW